MTFKIQNEFYFTNNVTRLFISGVMIDNEKYIRICFRNADKSVHMLTYHIYKQDDKIEDRLAQMLRKAIEERLARGSEYIDIDYCIHNINQKTNNAVFIHSSWL